MSGSDTEVEANNDIRKQLFGRTHETTLLCNAVQCWGEVNRHDDTAHRRTTVPHVGLVLLSGPRGVGKRALVETSLIPHVPRDALHLSGRFAPRDAATSESNGTARDHWAASSPFRVICDALEQTIRTMDSITLQQVRTAVALHFTAPSRGRDILTQGLLSTTLVRALFSNDGTPGGTASTWRPYRGERGPNQEHGAALARCCLVLSTCRPVLWHLQHVQWADPESLQVIQILLQTNWDDVAFNGTLGTQGLLIVASYRDDASSRDNVVPLVELNNDNDVKHRIHCIALTNLSRNNIHRWVEASLVSPIDETTMRSWVHLVFDITAGNPLHVQYLLYHLQDTLQSMNDQELDMLRREVPTDLDSLLVRILDRLPGDLRHVVETAAAIGDCTCGSFDHSVLEMVLQRPCSIDVAQLQQCNVLELNGDQVRFYQPELQALAYSLIAEGHRAALHLKIGRRIWKNSSLGAENELDEGGRTLGLMAQQLSRGLHMVTDSEELKVIAVIHIRVGKQAMGTSSFASAVAHFETAKRALGDQLWSLERYEIGLMLCNCLAEALYCTGEFEAMENTLNDILCMALSFQDRLQAYNTYVFTNGARHKLNDAVTMALQVLKQLGEPIAPNPSSLAVMVEYLRVRHMMRGKKDRYFLSLPAATDVNKIAAMQMLNFTFLYSYVINPKCGAMAACRMLRLTMIHGMTGAGSMAFCAFGLLLNGFGRIEESYRFGQIALNLLERFDGEAWMPRIYFFVYGLLHQNCRPLKLALEPLKRAHASALATGDIEGSAITAGSYLAMAFHSGAPLQALEQETASFCKLMESMGQTLGLIFIVPQWNVMCRLSGTSALSLLLNGPVTDGDSAFDHASKEGNGVALFVYYMGQTVSYCMLGEFTATIEMAEQAWASTSENDYHLIFFHGLAALGLARNRATWTCRRKHWSVGVHAVKQLQKWSRICPANALNKQYLLEAELAALRGNSIRALLLYDESIKHANQEGLLHEEGLAYERLAHYHFYLGHLRTVAPYFECARDVYRKWGASVLVRRMDEFLAALPPRV